MKTPRPLRRALVVMALPSLLLAGCASGLRSSADPAAPANQLAFGVDMARRGLWQEALFRFRQAERADASDPRVLNNLAVAYEAVGEFDQALEVYKRALAADPQNRELKRNYARFVEFYQSFRPKVAAGTGSTTTAPTAPPGESLSAGRAPAVPGTPAPPRRPPPSPVDPGDPAPVDPDAGLTAEPR